MTEAKVQFLSITGAPCAPGEKPARFSFVCVGHNRGKPMKLAEFNPTMCGNLLLVPGPFTADHGIKRDPQGNNGGRPQWQWDGNPVAPTLSPSINCAGHCGWHGYIRKGRCVNTAGEDEPL